MMAEIYTRSGFIADSAPEPITLDAFLAAPGNISAIILEPNAPLDALQPFLGQLATITINFPKFSDGRGYSLAARLRLHYQYQGALRASGEVLADQIQFFFRQGFDELAITNEPALARLKAGIGPAHSDFMQADIQNQEPVAAKGNAYSWRRSA